MTDAAPRTPTPEAVARDLGRYLSLGELGRGGMGFVLRAYDPKMQREVALKVVHRGALSSEVQTRLVREARAMAQLSHPNVVAVYDVELEVPHEVLLVMEYVPGPTLREWMKVERPWAEVLDAFVAAGRGLAAAHARGLLHRDFKPANVIVGEPEESSGLDLGRVRVVDFGLARTSVEPSVSGGEEPSTWIDAGRADPALTTDGVVVGTPAFMPPEQHVGADLTPATDQYAFCVSLWQALCGTLPFRGRSTEALCRAKLDGPPAWPAYTRAAGIPRSVVEAIRRGLAPAAADRWPSMDALLRALQRRPLRRLQLAVVGTTALLAAGVAVAAAQHESNPPCRGAMAQLRGVWDPDVRASAEAAFEASTLSYAPEVWSRVDTHLQQYTQQWVDQHTAACEATAVRGEQSTAVLDLRMACLQRAKTALSALSQRLVEADDTTVEKAHQLVNGLPSPARCSDIEALQADVAPPAADEAQTVEHVRRLLLDSYNAMQLGKFDEMLELTAQAQTAAEGLHYSPLRSEIALYRSRARHRTGDYEAALAQARVALREGATHRLWDMFGHAAKELAFMLAEQSRFAEALAYVKVARGWAKSTGDAGAEAEVSATVATIYERQGKLAQAEAKLREVLAVRLADPHTTDSSIAVTRNSLGSTLHAQAKYDEAAEQYEIATGIWETVAGPAHPYVALVRNNRANTLEKIGRHAEAEGELRAALESLVAALGPEHPHVILLRHNLCSALQSQGKYAQAEAESRVSLEGATKAFGPEHPNTAAIRASLANTLMLRGRSAEAEAEFREALERQIPALGLGHPSVSSTRDSLASALFRQGKLVEAEAEHRQTLAARSKFLGPEHPSVGDSHHNLAAVLEARGKHTEADEHQRLALRLWLDAYGPDHPHIAAAHQGLANILLGQGKQAAALRELEAAWAGRQDPAIPTEQRAETAFALAQTLWETAGNRSRARDLAQRAERLYRQAADGHADALERVQAWRAAHR